MIHTKEVVDVLNEFDQVKSRRTEGGAETLRTVITDYFNLIWEDLNYSKLKDDQRKQ